MMEIALAGWSLNRRFRRSTNPLMLLDYPAVAVQEFGINKIELNSPFFPFDDPDDQMTSNVPARYLQELKRAALDAETEIVGIAVDHCGDLAATDLAERKQAIEGHRKWFDICKALDCQAFRANSGGRGNQDNPEAVAACADSFAQLARLAQEANITLLMENHWGISMNPDNMVKIVTTVNSPNFGALADFGNFPDEYRIEALRKIAPCTRFVHAKFRQFDSNGEDTQIDAKTCIHIFKDVGYDGLFGIEFEGEGNDHDGVLKSKALLERYAYS